MFKKKYSVHNIVNFEIIDKSGFLRSGIDLTGIQFRNFETTGDVEIDFSVEIGPFSRRRNKCFILDDRYFVDDGYFYCKDKRKFSRWELEVCDVEHRPKVRINTNIAGYYTAPLNIIEFFIHYMLLRKDRALIHSSGVGQDNVCVLFSARGGGGKTTVALTLVDQGYMYLGDNFVLLDRGKAFSFVSPLNIFSYNRLPVIERNLTRKQRFSMEVKQLIHKVSGGYVKIFEKIDPYTMFPKQISNFAEIGAICILEPTTEKNDNEVAVIPISDKKLAKKLRYNMELDLIQFSKYMYSYGYINTNSMWASFWELYEQSVLRNIQGLNKCYELQVPMRYSTETVLGVINNAWHGAKMEDYP